MISNIYSHMLTTVSALLLIGSAFLLIYTHFLYPLVMRLLAVLFPDQVEPGDEKPGVTVLLSVYNEEQVIKDKLENTLNQNYPSEKLTVIVGSDGSTDRTHEIIRQYQDERLSLSVVEPREGKSNVLNQIVQETEDEILVFTDADTYLEEDAISKLVRRFSDDEVGIVAGKIIQTGVSESGSGEGSGLYRQIDASLKLSESRFSSVIVADGRIFALRTSQYEEIPKRVAPDFFLSLRVIAGGHRVVFEPEARAWERAATDYREEFQRKRRIVGRGFYCLPFVKEVFNPFLHPREAWQVFSHKLLRWIGFGLMCIAFLTNAHLFWETDLMAWDLLFYGQLAFYFLAGTGWLIETSRFQTNPGTLPFYFTFVHLAAFLGLIDYLRGKVPATWEQAKSARKEFPSPATDDSGSVV